ncbi:MAG: hypothetical protein ACK4KW_13840 [Gemmobacter sp.]
MNHRALPPATAALALAAGLAFAQAGFEFMPDGGRTLVLRLYGADPVALAEVVAQEHDANGWAEVIVAEAAARDVPMTDPERLTLAHYLALNLPLADPAAVADLAPEDLARALPMDGKDLAIRHCQGCHGFYTAYLGHDREVNGWLVVFNSPFHMEIRMSPTEKRTFAHYSAINLPMRIEDVPPEMRF